MRISTFWYCLKQGVKNICRNIWFSLASAATISACIFLFCLFFSVVMNIQYMVKNVESTVGITMFFDEELDEAQIRALGDEIAKRSEIREMTFISAEEAWDQFKSEYFAGHEELAEGYADDNPLAGSDSYQIFLYDIADQPQLVSYLEGLSGVRQVNYSNSAVSGFSSFNRVVGLVSAVIVGVLLAVSIFLINNTISVAAAFRRTENEIMKLIGATNFMIRAPFIVEGVLLGLLGAVLPLAAMFFLYAKAIAYIVERFQILSDVFVFLPIEMIFPQMVVVSMALGVGIGFFGSFFTVRKHLRV